LADDTEKVRAGWASRGWEWIKSGAVALVLWYLITSLAIQAFRIPSGSMEGTLLSGDFLFANKALYGAEIPLIGKRLPAFREPRRSDIVIFDSATEAGISVVKRVIGMAGDTLQMEKNVLYRNGRRMDEPYVITDDQPLDPSAPEMRAWQPRYYIGPNPRSYRPTLKTWGPIVVPPDSFFVMGDNRDNSYDSRYWGFLGRDRIRGRPMLVYYSFDNDVSALFPFLTAVRWGRLLTRPS